MHTWGPCGGGERLGAIVSLSRERERERLRERLTPGLQNGEDGFDHAGPHSLPLCPRHQVNVQVGGVVSLEGGGKEELGAGQLSQQLL